MLFYKQAIAASARSSALGNKPIFMATKHAPMRETSKFGAKFDAWLNQRALQPNFLMRS